MDENEWRLAYSRATNKNHANEIVELIEEHRKPFAEGKTANIGTAIFASAEAWEAIACASDEDAKRELLKSSANLTELEKLERAARQAQEAADAASRELQAVWQEFNGIPDQLEAIAVKQEQISNERQALETEKLEAEFKRLYRSLLDGARASVGFMDQIAVRLATTPLRREVLSSVDAELSAKADDLKVRQKQLSKRLGMKL